MGSTPPQEIPRARLHGPSELSWLFFVSIIPPPKSQATFILVTTKTTVGVSFAVSIPLAIVAFRVNQITARITPWFGSSSKQSRAANSHTTNKDESDDSDSDSTLASDHNVLCEEPGHSSVESVRSMTKYAPLFGRWDFHQKVPLLRWFWRYRWWGTSKLPLTRRDNDYPLHHALHAMRWLVFRLVSGLLELTGPVRLQIWVLDRLLDAEWEHQVRVLQAWSSARAGDSNV